MKSGARSPFPLTLLRFWGRRVLLVWSLIAVVIFLFQLAICGILHDNEKIQALVTYMEVLPSFLKSVIGGEMLRMGNTSAFIAIGYKHPLVFLLFMLFAVGVPTGLLAGEAQHGRMELILSRSATRTQVYLCAGALTIAGMFALVLVMFFGTFIATNLYDFGEPIPLYPFFIVAINGGLLASAVAAVSLLAAASFRQRGLAVGVTVVYLVVNYFVNLFSEWWPPMEPLGPLTPFWYIDGPTIFRDVAWPLGDMGVLASLLVIAAVAGGVTWSRRDLPA